MKYVYLLASVNFPEETYIGLTDGLRKRRVTSISEAAASPCSTKIRTSPSALIPHLGQSKRDSLQTHFQTITDFASVEPDGYMIGEKRFSKELDLIPFEP